MLIRSTRSNAALQSHQHKTLTPGEQGAIVKPTVQQSQVHGWCYEKPPHLLDNDLKRKKGSTHN